MSPAHAPPPLSPFPAPALFFLRTGPSPATLSLTVAVPTPLLYRCCSGGGLLVCRGWPTRAPDRPALHRLRLLLHHHLQRQWCVRRCSLHLRVCRWVLGCAVREVLRLRGAQGQDGQGMGWGVWCVYDVYGM
jgi:hypothetical protein